MNELFPARHRSSIICGVFGFVLSLLQTTASADNLDIQYNKNGVPESAAGVSAGTVIKDPKTGEEFEVLGGGTLIGLTGEKPAIEELSKIPAREKPIPDPGWKWRNPIVRLDDTGLHVDPSPNPCLEEDLLKTLASIPRAGWPYGRVIELAAYPGLSGSRYSERERADTIAEVLTLLKLAKIEIIPASSA